MQTPSGSDRLSTALGALGRASGRFDVRATLAVTMTLATIAMILAVEDIPDAWWLAWGLGHHLLLSSTCTSCRTASMIELPPYQVEVGAAVMRSIEGRKGYTFTVEMARQAGKNELSAQLEMLLLAANAARGGPGREGVPDLQASDAELDTAAKGQAAR